MSDLLDRLRAMYSHRGDGIPTQYVNPDGPEAAERIERAEAALGEAVRALGELTRCFNDEGLHIAPAQGGNPVQRTAVTCARAFLATLQQAEPVGENRQEIE